MSSSLADVVSRSSPAERSTHARRYDRVYSAMLFAIDVAMFVGAALTAQAIAYHTFGLHGLFWEFIEAPIIFVVLWVLLFERIGLYRVSFAMTVRDEVYVVATALVLGVIPQLVLLTLVPSLSGSRFVLVTAALIAIVSVGGSRAFLHLQRDRGERIRPKQIAVVARGEDAFAIGETMDFPTGSAVHSIGAPPERNPDVVALIDRCVALGCDALYLGSMPSPSIAASLVARAAHHGVTVRIALAPLRTGAYRFDIEPAGNGVLLAPRLLRVRSTTGRLYKRLFDVALALPMLLIAAPVMLLAALAIVCETGWPVFYRQERIGVDGTRFTMLKFRSMFVRHRHGDGWATRRDPRITRVGAFLRRFSIDELPQLINVLRGEMSIVGPRPEMPAYVERFEAEIPRYVDRHLVKPGITGWSQIYMNRLLTPEDVRDVLRHDLFYIENWGLFMDLSIVAKTAFEFLFHRPA